MRVLVHTFIRTECAEVEMAEMCVALGDTAPFYRDAPEVQEARASGDDVVQVFMQGALPGTSDVIRALAGDPITTTLSAAGQQFSENPPSLPEIEAYSDAMADMFCAYLEGRKRG